MKIALLSNPKNRYAPTLAQTLREQYGHTVERIDNHPPELAELLRGTDLAISWFYRWILCPHEFNAPQHGTVNYHIGALPWGRGAMPNVWAIVEATPVGATMHMMDTGVDTGPILYQRETEILATDTGESLYWRLCAVAEHLFHSTWADFQERLLDGTLTPQPQPEGDYPTHRVKDVARLDDLEARFGPVAREVVDVLSARTFRPYEAAFLRDEQGRKVYVRVELSYA